VKRFLIPVAALVALVGCNNPITDPALVSQCGDELTQERAEALVDRAVAILPLKDPDSAQIRDIVIDGPRKWFNVQGNAYGQQVSFQLNAKNSYGGYTGAQRYIVLLSPNGRFQIRPATAWDI
jgi:hypothetical protein